MPGRSGGFYTVSASATVGPKILIFDLTGLGSADWSGDATKGITADDGASYTWAIVDAGTDMDTGNFGPTGSGLALGTNGAGATKREYSEQNGVGLEIASSTLFAAIAAGDALEIRAQWADANASSANFQGFSVQAHDDAGSNNGLIGIYGNGYGVRGVQRRAGTGVPIGAAQTSPSNTPPTTIALYLHGDYFGDVFYRNTGAMGDPLSGTWLTRTEKANDQTGRSFDVSAAKIRITAESHGTTGWPPVLEKIQITWWPATVQ